MNYNSLFYCPVLLPGFLFSFVGGKGVCIFNEIKICTRKSKNYNCMVQYICTRWIPSYETSPIIGSLNRISSTEIPSSFFSVISTERVMIRFEFQYHRLVLSIFEHDVSGTTSIYFSVPCFVHSGKFLRFIHIIAWVQFIYPHYNLEFHCESMVIYHFSNNVKCYHTELNCFMGNLNFTF